MALPSDFQDPTIPTNMREFYMLYYADRQRSILDNESLAKKLNSLDEKIDTVVTCQSNQDIRIDHLEKRVNSWSLINSLGVIFAAILAAIGLKSS